VTARHPIEVAHDTWRLSTDSAEEILGRFIDGYPEQADEQAHRQARLGLALQARRTVQTLLNAGEQFDQSTAEEAEILLDRSDVAPAVGQWRCPIPLVLVTVFYAPLGQLPQPRTEPPGQVWWIDPSTPQTLLRTLHQVRWLDLTIGDHETWEPDSQAYRNLGENGMAGYRWRSVST
jgi:hypothetical protein